MSTGLSPRVRGNHDPAYRAKSLVWSIPACAGEPADALADVTRLTVYPRVCGGTSGGSGCSIGRGGLSPRVRGNQANDAHNQVADGSIPACAGEPSGSGPSLSGSGVYPRVCGGTLGGSRRAAMIVGLSPRVRGNLPALVPALPIPGSIPACAGEPVPGASQTDASRVYPRVCGGTVSPISMATPLVGLSPRVRGNRIGKAILRLDIGSIPACAGEPTSGKIDKQLSGVYPRVCGGTHVGQD